MNRRSGSGCHEQRDNCYWSWAHRLQVKDVRLEVNSRRNFRRFVGYLDEKTESFGRGSEPRRSSKVTDSEEVEQKE